MSEISHTTKVTAPPDDDPFWGSPLRDQVKEWLQANNISLRIPRRDITITGPPGNRTIHYTAFVLSGDGRIQVDPNDKDEALMEERTTPCLVEPPTACVCGEPEASGTTHRVDGPCYVAEPGCTCGPPPGGICVHDVTTTAPGPRKQRREQAP